MLKKIRRQQEKKYHRTGKSRVRMIHTGGGKDKADRKLGPNGNREHQGKGVRDNNK